MSRIGYQADYLGDGLRFEVPEISFEHAGDIVRLEDGTASLDYLNYSVVLNRSTRQAFYSAANADFSRNTGEGRDFRLDRRVDERAQLDNLYYKDLDGVENPYDRGHLTRRDAISWGRTRHQANKASRDSCYYPNVVLQHKRFNRDEWHALEVAIEDNHTDADNRFDVICGPIFSAIDRFVMPTRYVDPARVPSGFWKVIAYVGRDSGELEVNAFVVHQDDESLRKMGQVLGREGVDPFRIYQSSTTLIEELTGLTFPDVAYDKNPMYFFESEKTREAHIVTPQLQEISEETDGVIFRQ
ncbi:MAG: DNA/RNA non-specific endonuclease [Gammaproteobacteria bacterium]|nr:DNA/RNA non-specific endonuclease [Gammaproteobacteria bacterium]